MTRNNDAIPNINKLLFHHPLPMKQYYQDSLFTVSVADGSALPFFLEEVIALSAGKIVIPTAPPVKHFSDALPPQLKNRIIVADDITVKQQLFALFEPIADEFNFNLIYKGGFGLEKINELPPDLSAAIKRIYFDLSHFLLGIEHKSMIHINIGNVKCDLNMIRNKSKNPKSRSNLAILEGIFFSYNTTSVSSLSINNSVRHDLAREFILLIEDSLYRQMAEASFLLGFLQRVKHAVSMIHAAALNIVDKHPVKGLWNIGAKLIETITKLPIPDSAITSALIKEEYLPPIVNLDDAFQKALSNWQVQNPNFIPAIFENL